MNPDWTKVQGTVMLDLPDDFIVYDLKKIIAAVTKVTGVEGGYSMAITMSGTVMFFHLTERESDMFKENLTDIFDIEYVEDVLCYTYDDDFPEGDEE